MTKKKMKKLIIVGILIFYVASMILVFTTSRAFVSDNFSDVFGNPVYYNQGEMLESLKDDLAVEESLKHSNCNEGEMFAYYLCELYGNVKYPYVFTVVDENLNVYEISNNFILINWWDKGYDQIVSFDEYLTEETRDTIIKFIGKTRDGYYWLEELKLYEAYDVYIPVSMKVCGNGKDGKKVQEEIKITDYIANIVINKEVMGKSSVSMWPFLRELKLPAYHRDNFEKYAEDLIVYMDLNKDNFSTNGGGGSIGEGDCAYSYGYKINGKGYEIYVKGGYDIITHTLMSDVFNYYAVYLTVLFAVAGVIFYIMCMKVITKSEKLDEAKTTFISGASHELKTPLAVIQNQCECIMENIAPEKNEQYIKSIYDEAIRMNGIVSSLLSYSRLTQMTKIEKESCNLSELLRGEVSNYSKFAENSGVTIEENIADNIYADCNVQLMKMAIDNYLSNAVKYSAGDKNVQVNLLEKNGNFTLAVINTANEYDVKNAEESWSEFSRGDESRQRKGKSIGMGLPICKKIFELHSFKGYCKYNEGRVSFVVTGIKAK